MAMRFVMVTQDAQKVVVTSKAVGFLAYAVRGGAGPFAYRDGRRFDQTYAFMPKSKLRDLVLASGGNDPMLGTAKRFVAVAPDWLYEKKFLADGLAVDGDARVVDGGRSVAKTLAGEGMWARDLEDYMPEHRVWKGGAV